jgi:hypothetical protein
MARSPRTYLTTTARGLARRALRKPSYRVCATGQCIAIQAPVISNQLQPIAGARSTRRARRAVRFHFRRSANTAAAATLAAGRDQRADPTTGGYVRRVCSGASRGDMGRTAGGRRTHFRSGRMTEAQHDVPPVAQGKQTTSGHRETKRNEATVHHTWPLRRREQENPRLE